jgi:hypothetical protein
VAGQLAAAGINTLTLAMRGYGESGGTPCAISLDVSLSCQQMPGDIDIALQYLVSQPGVKRDVIGVGGAGLLGVDGSVQAARRHSAEVKSLVLLSGETFQPNLQFLRQASQLPGLFVVSDEMMNTLPRKRRWNCSTSPPPTRARSSCTTLRRKTRPGYGMNPSISAESPPTAATEPTCSKFIRSCAASS